MAKSTLPKPVYAYVGVTDLAVEVVRDLVTETQTRIAGVQKDVTARVADVQKTAGDPKALRERATTVVSARVDALAKDAKARREAIESRVAELQAEAKELPARVTDVYTDLAKRGEVLVGRIRRQESTKATAKSAGTTTAKAKTTRTQAAKTTKSTARKTTTGVKSTAKKATTTAKDSSAPSSAKATTTAAKKAASNATTAAADAAKKVGD
jgi:heparin binding hemagglutinin HbhA